MNNEGSLFIVHYPYSWSMTVRNIEANDFVVEWPKVSVVRVRAVDKDKLYSSNNIYSLRDLFATTYVNCTPMSRPTCISVSNTRKVSSAAQYDQTTPEFYQARRRKRKVSRTAAKDPPLRG